MGNLAILIHFWRSILDDKDNGLSSNILDYIILTIASLEELQKIKEGE